MTTTLPETAAAYVRTTNNNDPAGFIACFSESAIVHDAGREFRGIAAIKNWSDHEIFGASVTLEVLDVVDRDGETVISTRVDGTFDKTGLPDPLVLDHHIKVEGGKIVGLACRLASDDSRS